MSKSQKSNKFIRDWRPTGKQYAEAEKGVYESKNVSVLVALVLSLLANLLSVVCFIVSGIDLGLAFVGVMLACDVLFLVLFSKINFCCKYSAGFVALYLAINVLLTVFSLLLGLSVIGDGSLFTVFGVILRIASILVFTLVLLLSVRTARTSKRAVSFSVVLSVLLLGGLVYGQLFYGGYYGQNYSVLNGERAVVYVLRTDEDGEEYYFAKKVLPGLGTSVVVEDTYLGKEVRGVTVDVLSAPRLKTVALKGDRVMSLGVPQEIPEDIKFPNITVKKELVEAYRQQAFEQATVLRNKLTAAYLPELAEDEVAVRFEYDTAEISAELYNAENVLPVLVLKKGESVELSDLSALMQNYYTQENVLEWSFENAYGWNLLDMQANGEDIFSAVINKNTTFKVNFEPVKKVEYYLADADYYTPANFDRIGYISPSAEEVETDYNHREGCQVTMAVNGYDQFQDVESLRSVAFSAEYQWNDTVTANVMYRMITPVIAQFEATAENRQQADVFTYGDELNLEFAVEEHGANITYTLMEGAESGSMVTLHDNSEVASYFAGVRTPGTQYFYLVARASDVYGNPELYMEAHHTLQFDVQKKTISGVWDLSQLPAEYDSLTHNASYSIDQTQAVTENGASAPDALTFSTTETAVLNAGEYTFVATLDEALFEKYVLTAHTAVHTVARRVVDVAWDTTEFVYDGEEHVPMASWTLADGSPVTQFDIGNTDANVGGGKYTATVQINDENHIFASGETTSTQYVINPKTLSMQDSDWADLSFVYNNTKRTPTATVATGVAADGTMTLTVSGGQTNAGSYTATASTSNTNYKLEGVTTHAFTIDKAEAAVTWSNLSLVFNGNKQLPTAKYATFTTSGAQTGTATAKVTATTESVNVDSYTANATAASTLDEQNYTLTNATSGFDITKKTVSAVWGNATFTFNGKDQAPAATYKDAKNQTVSLTVSGAQTNVGSDYSASASLATSLEQQNYTLENTETTFKITQKSVAAVWTQNEFTYDGTEKELKATYVNALGESVALSVTSSTRTIAGTNHTNASLKTALEQQNYTLTNTSKDLIINRVKVTVQWSNLTVVYNGEVQWAVAQYKDINGDMQSLSLDKGAANVGTYTVTLADQPTNYECTPISNTFKVTPYTVTTIEWIGDTSYTYNGTVQGLTARYQNLTGGYTTAYETDKKNAGTYTAAAVTNDANYQFATTAQTTKQFTINPAEIVLSWSNTSFTYDGTEKKPTATIATGVIGGETVTVTVSGGQTNAGTYTATAYITDKNYTLKNPTQEFTIAKKQVRVSSWSNLSQTYTGSVLKPTATCSDASVTLIVDGGQTNVGTYTVTAKLSSTDAANYELTGEVTSQFKVLVKEIQVTWSGNSFTYDGTEKKPTATYQGVTITVSVAAKSGSALTGGKAIDEGSYTATATTSNQNYKITNATYDFTIVAVQNN